MWLPSSAGGGALGKAGVSSGVPLVWVPEHEEKVLLASCHLCPPDALIDFFKAAGKTAPEPEAGGFPKPFGEPLCSSLN